MKQAQRDELLEVQTASLERISVALGSYLSNLERDRRRQDAPVLPPLPTRLHGEPKWTAWTVVPGEYVKDGIYPVVRCVCGFETTLSLRAPMCCGGECGRWFVRVRDGVKAWRFPKENEAA